jgi:hypothetical protein
MTVRAWSILVNHSVFRTSPLWSKRTTLVARCVMADLAQWSHGGPTYYQGSSGQARRDPWPDQRLSGSDRGSETRLDAHQCFDPTLHRRGGAAGPLPCEPRLLKKSEIADIAVRHLEVDGELTTREVAERVMAERKLDVSDRILRNSVVFKVVQSLRHAARRKLVRMVEKRKGVCIWAIGEAVSLRVANSPSRLD